MFCNSPPSGELTKLRKSQKSMISLNFKLECNKIVHSVKFKLAVKLDLTAALKLPRRLSKIHTSLVLIALLFTLVDLLLIPVVLLKPSHFCTSVLLYLCTCRLGFLIELKLSSVIVLFLESTHSIRSLSVSSRVMCGCFHIFLFRHDLHLSTTINKIPKQTSDHAPCSSACLCRKSCSLSSLVHFLDCSHCDPPEQ